MCGAPVRNKGIVLKWTAGVSGTIAFFAITVRTVVALVGGSFGWDDSFAVLAWVFSLPVTILQFITPFMGFGQDTWMVDPKNIYKILQVSSLLYKRFEDSTNQKSADLCITDWLLSVFRLHKVVFLDLLSTDFPIS